MRVFIAAMLSLAFVLCSAAQEAQIKIFLTERAFERAVAEKGINSAFLEFLAPDAVMFFPEVKNAHSMWRSFPVSPASLTWNPTIIEVSSNEVLGYSIGTSIYRAKGKDDPNAVSGHYISVWRREPDASYKAIFDSGIHHPTSAVISTLWKPATIIARADPKGVSAADASSVFFRSIEIDPGGAYSSFLSEDCVLLRQGYQPFRGKRSAVDLVRNQKGKLSFSKRPLFLEAGDLGYVYGSYAFSGKGKDKDEKGNFMQVWRFAGKWQIVADIQVPIPDTNK